MNLRVTESEIKESYAGVEFAEKYTERRFIGELFQLLHERQVAAVHHAIERSGAKRILEIAPGPGRVTRDVQFGGDWVCLEFNDGMIKVGRSVTGPNVQWVQGDGFAMPTDGPFAEPFDTAYTFRFIRHFKREDRNRLYGQIRERLRPGGYLVFDAVNAVVSKPIRDASPDAYDIYDVLYDSSDDLKNELAEEGFTDIQFEPVQRQFPLQHKIQCTVGPRSSWLSRALIDGLEKMSRGPSLEWIVTCRRE